MTTTPKEVKRLVERFRENGDGYLSSEYNETQLRREFLDPFFKALGWDVDNEQGYAEAYKDVVHEDAIKVGGATKAPDYAFRIGGTRKFFVEAKRPSVGIKDDPDAAYQLRRYAWSAKLPLSILTDFEEFAVYDCRVRPNKNDKASTARTLYFTFEEYETKWDEIAGIFSLESIRKGSFDKYVEAKKKRGTAEVDDVFLKEIEGWRDVLARNIAIRNTGLSNREVNFAVQRTIDRIIFLRICEDRGIESYGQLMALRNGHDVYRRLCQVFRNADDRYNSGLFHFRVEKDRGEAPDELTLGLEIDDKLLKDVFKDLYYPDSPYEFSVLPADILGHIYEQFLGKVIRLTPAHRAVVEEKPEVRKAGGVYYTPTYIVDYIVEHTVGKLLGGKTPNQVAKLRVLDPACGSGSFLLGAYQRLLDWHLAWYAENEPEKHRKGRKPKIFQGPGDDWRLTTAEKKRILLNNVYGVDIDPQAVEVTKLSLLLKVLEGESDETLGKTLRMFHERALPDLGANIKCGNSLIGPDFYEGKQLSLIDEEERYRINAFDWNAEFPEIMEAGGFDAVIGNPPWISAWTGSTPIRQYLVGTYGELQGHWDMYLAFLVATEQYLSAQGVHAFVYPTSFLTEAYAATTRARLVMGACLQSIAVFGLERIFSGVSRRVCVVVLGRGGHKRVVVDHWASKQHVQSLVLDPKLWLTSEDCTYSVHVGQADIELKNRVTENSIRIGNVYYVNYGAQICSKKKGEFGRDRFLGNKPHGNARRFLDGADVKRYSIAWRGMYLDYRPNDIYGARHPKLFESPKLIVNKVTTKGYALSVTYDVDGYYCDQRLICLVRYPDLEGTNLRLAFKGYSRVQDSASDLYYVALLNSRLYSYYFSRFVATRNLQGEYSDVVPRMVRSLPIRQPTLGTVAGRELHDRMTILAETMLALHSDLPKASSPHGREVIQRQIDATDKQIDQLVYKLYGLTGKEIRIVEEATK